MTAPNSLPAPPADLLAPGAPTLPRFQPGDRVMVSPYGLGIICELCVRPGLAGGVAVGGVAVGAAAYYAVTFQGSSSRAFVPLDAPAGGGIRAALTAHDLPALLNRLQTGTLELPRQWSARQRRVQELISGGDPLELAALTCELRRWNVRRGLPDLDRQAFRRAIRLLEQEVGDLDEPQARQVRELLEAAWGEQPGGSQGNSQGSSQGG